MTMNNTLNQAKATIAKANAKAEAIAKTVAKYEAKEAVKAYADYTVNYSHLISASVEVADAKDYEYAVGISSEIVAKLSYISYSSNKEVAVVECLAKASAEVASLAVEAIAKVTKYANSLAWYQLWAKADASATLVSLLKAEAKHTVVATLVKNKASEVKVKVSANRNNRNY